MQGNGASEGEALYWINAHPLGHTRNAVRIQPRIIERFGQDLGMVLPQKKKKWPSS